MDNDNVQIFYDGNGTAVAVQMPISDYEKIIKHTPWRSFVT